MLKNISFIAGDRAIEIIRDEGLNLDRVRVIPGAAGGPKWLVLGGIDRVLFGKYFRNRKQPLFLLGSSIGSWRFAALSQADPELAIDAFEALYLDQRYSRFPTTDEVSTASWKILDGYVNDDTSLADTHPSLYPAKHARRQIQEPIYVTDAPGSRGRNGPGDHRQFRYPTRHGPFF